MFHSIFLRWMKISSGWLEPWEGLLFATDVSTTCAEAIFRVKSDSERKMASAQVVETSVANISPSQDSNHPDAGSFSIKVYYFWVQTIFLCYISVHKKTFLSIRWEVISPRYFFFQYLVSEVFVAIVAYTLDWRAHVVFSSFRCSRVLHGQFVLASKMLR